MTPETHHTWAVVAYGFLCGNGDDLPTFALVVVFVFLGFLYWRMFL